MIEPMKGMKYMKMPSVFVGHGSPMNAVEENNWTKKWTEI